MLEDAVSATEGRLVSQTAFWDFSGSSMGSLLGVMERESSTKMDSSLD